MNRILKKNHSQNNDNSLNLYFFKHIHTSFQDNRLEYLKTHPKVYAQFVSSLFAILYAVYSSSAGPQIKHQCLRSLLRMIYFSPKEEEEENSNKKYSENKDNKEEESKK